MIYLDNSATTKVSTAASEKMLLACHQAWGNPSSLHKMGLSAEKCVQEARKNILAALGMKNLLADKIIFTSGGTEANNLAVFGTAYAKKNNRAKRVITTDSEHPSVLECVKKLEGEGFEVVRLSTKNGVLDMEQLKAAITGDAILLSIMHVNNETGAVYDIKGAFALAKKINPAIVTHTDAVQGFLKLRSDYSRAGADLITVSGHKIHAPKGIGALYISAAVIKAKKIMPLLLGGGQEGAFRSGTENVPGIAALGEAVTALPEPEKMAALREYLLKNLPGEVRANIPCGEAAPHILNITLPGIKSETMLQFLSAREIYVSSGSACASRSRHVSHALLAFGLDESTADCSLRISLCGDNTYEELDQFLQAMREGLASLVRMKS